MKNKYVKRSRISEAKFRELIKYFSLDLDASKIATLTGLNRNTINRYLALIRQRIAELCEQESPFKGVIEVDESYFGARRVRGKRGRGASGKTPVFGILQRGGRVYTEIVPDCAKANLQAIIRGKVDAHKASYTPMAGVDIMAWLTWDIKSIFASIMAVISSPGGETTSTALSPSGPLQRQGL